MRSRTSFFNPTVFKKTIARFWPLWVAYAAVWFLILPLTITATRGNVADSLYMNMEQSIRNAAVRASPIIAAIFAVLTAMAVFSWLYSPRSAGFTAALPIRREAMFLSCFGAGLAMLLLGNVLTFLSAWGFALSRGATDALPLLQWLAAASLDVLSFYGFAALCAMLTGRLLIVPLVFAALQFAEVTVENLADYLISCISFGYTQHSSRLSFLSPLWTRLREVWVAADMHEDAFGNMVRDGYHISGWGYILGYAFAGLLFAALALALYKRRRMETASDTVAVRQLKPVFRWCLSIGCALCLAAGVWTTVESGYTPGDWARALLLLGLLLLGTLIGWVGADMLMYKTFRALRLHPRGLVLLCAVFCALTLGVETDVFSLERRVPADFARVYIETNGESVSLVGETAKSAAAALNRSVIENKALHEASERLRLVRLEYYGTAEDGSETELISRAYRIASGEAQERDNASDLRELERILNLPESIEARKNIPFAVNAESIDYASVSFDIDGKYAYAADDKTTEAAIGEPLVLTQDEAWELYNECILPDIADNALGRIWLVQDETYERTVCCCTIQIEFSSRREDGSHNYEYFYTVPTVDSARTNAWLAAHGVELLTVAQARTRYPGA